MQIDAAELQVKLVEGELYPTLNVVGQRSPRHGLYRHTQRNVPEWRGDTATQRADLSRAAKFTLAPARRRRRLAQARLQADLQRDSVRAERGLDLGRNSTRRGR